MLFNIPQFIDKEDKIVGPLTAKQLGWMFGGGAILLILWSILDTSGFFVAAIPVVALILALAFYHPNGQTLIAFTLSSFHFAFRPKIYVWKRMPEKEMQKETVAKKIGIIKVEKKVDGKRIEEISKLLDRQNH